MDRVIYMGTFSKTMFPSLRLGYLIVPPSLVDAFRDARAVFDHFSPNVEQATLAEFIEKGHFTAHVRRMRREYASRQKALLRALAAELGDLVAAKPADTGMHVVAWLRDTTIDDALVSRLASAAGVEVAPLSMYRMAATLGPALLMGFARVYVGAHFPLDVRLERGEHFVDLVKVVLEPCQRVARTHLRRRDPEVEIDVRVHSEQEMLHDHDAAARPRGERGAPRVGWRETAAVQVEGVQIAVGEHDIQSLHSRPVLEPAGGDSVFDGGRHGAIQYREEPEAIALDDRALDDCVEASDHFVDRLRGNEIR
jgi:hypothetical protein